MASWCSDFILVVLLLHFDFSTTNPVEARVHHMMDSSKSIGTNGHLNDANEFMTMDTIGGDVDSHEGQSMIFNAIYGFGDSLTDTGNGLILIQKGSSQLPPLQGTAPYGETFFGRPMGRFSDGRLVVDYFAEQVGAPYFLQPFLGLSNDMQSGGANEATNTSYKELINFAVAGATVLSLAYLNATFNVTPLTPYSLDLQLQWFSSLPSSHNLETLSSALIFMGPIGGNDYNYVLKKATAINDILNMVPRVISNMKNTLEFMIANGARYIVVQGIYPIGCFPLYKEIYANSTRDRHDCVEDFQMLTNLHNKLLAQLVENITTNNNNIVGGNATNDTKQSVNLIFLDSENAFREVFDNPSQYGFTSSKDPCYAITNMFLGAPINTSQAELCPNPSNYIIWDGVHLTDAMHKVLVDLFYSTDYAKPYPNFLTHYAASRH